MDSNLVSLITGLAFAFVFCVSVLLIFKSCDDDLSTKRFEICLEHGDLDKCLKLL